MINLLQPLRVAQKDAVGAVMPTTGAVGMESRQKAKLSFGPKKGGSPKTTPSREEDVPFSYHCPGRDDTLPF